MNTGMSGNTSGCASTPQRERHIPSQIAMLNNNIDRLDKAVGAIAERLVGVARQENIIQTEKDQVDKTEWIVPLAVDLRVMNSVLSKLVAAIEDLTDRLEV